MKLPLLAALGGLLLAPAAMAADKPELHGMIVTSNDQRFLVVPRTGGKSEWVGVGDTVGDWKVAEYRAKEQLLVLKGTDGTEVDLALAEGGVKQGEAPGTLADAQHLFEKMHFAEMFSKIMDQQKAMVSRQMSRGLDSIKGDATPDEVNDFKQKVLDKLWSGVDGSKVADAMMQIYSQTFTSDQLHAITDFYDTPAGQAVIANTPQIQGKISQMIQGQIQATLPAVAQMQKDFIAQHSGSGPSPAATPAAAPAATHP